MQREEYIENILKNYRLVKVLSDKNECKTLHIRHKTLEKDLVLHSFPKSFEAYEMLCKIKCDCLPEIYDSICLCDGQIVLEEFIDGITVAEVMETGRYHYKGAKKVITAVCKALGILHNNGFVHRDIKPENIIVSKDGRVVLVDFNVSRTVKNVGHDTVVMGTVGYASPEQLGVAQSDARTDIYAVGVLLNVMITGCHPSVKLACGRIGKIVKKCTDISPAARYRTTDDLIQSL